MRVGVPRLPDLEVTVEGIRRLDIAHPLGIRGIVRSQPGGWQGRTVMVVEIAGEADAVAFELWLREWETRP
ncbi:hypothetical protein D3C76_1695220 [compost metagenome]